MERPVKRPAGFIQSEDVVDVRVPDSVIDRKDPKPNRSRWTVRPIEYVEIERGGQLYVVPTITYYGVRLVIAFKIDPHNPASWVAWRRLDKFWSYLAQEETSVVADIRANLEKGAEIDSAIWDAVRPYYERALARKRKELGI